MRSRASVPMAENMSANRVTWVEWALVIFRQYRKYRSMSRVFHARKDSKPATLAVVVSEECNVLYQALGGADLHLKATWL
jgi:hypothetical protein